MVAAECADLRYSRETAAELGSSIGVQHDLVYVHRLAVQVHPIELLHCFSSFLSRDKLHIGSALGLAAAPQSALPNNPSKANIEICWVMITMSIWLCFLGLPSTL